jgi:hypothetical protein
MIGSRFNAMQVDVVKPFSELLNLFLYFVPLSICFQIRFGRSFFAKSQLYYWIIKQEALNLCCTLSNMTFTAVSCTFFKLFQIPMRCRTGCKSFSCPKRVPVLFLLPRVLL